MVLKNYFNISRLITGKNGVEKKLANPENEKTASSFQIYYFCIF